MSVHVRISKGRIYLDIYHNGVRRWEKTGIVVSADSKARKDQMAMAEVIRAKREMELISADWQIIDKTKGRKILASEYMMQYGETKSATHPARFSAPKIIEYDDVPIGAITPAWLEGFKLHLQRNYSANTAAAYFAALKAALRRAYRDKILLTDPAAYVSGVSIPETNKVALTPQELELLASVPGPRSPATRRAFFFACLTGLRNSDLRTLLWGEIHRAGDRPYLQKKQQKTAVAVIIPLHPSALAAIDDGALHRDTELVFPGIPASSASLILWAKSAGIDKHIGWHTARHTFAVLSLEGGADLYTVSKLLGHTSIATTQVYARATDEMRRRAIEGLPAIGMGGQKKSPG